MTETLDDLLDGGRAALRHHGWAGATLERIARAAGRSRVTLHRRGVTKDAILDALVARAVTAYRDALWPALTAPGSAAERMEAALVALCECAEEWLDVLLALQARSDAVFHEDAEGETLTRTAFTEPFERLLRDGAADGTLRARDPEETATVLFNLAGWTYVHLRTGHRWAPERARRATVDLALHGLTAAPASVEG